MKKQKICPDNYNKEITTVNTMAHIKGKSRTEGLTAEFHHFKELILILLKCFQKKTKTRKRF
jgi:hypothetical protein